MSPVIGRLAIIGQGLIGSSITRAVYERKLARETVITDADPKVRKRLLELGLGEARVVDTASEAADGADMVIGCVPVRAYGEVVSEIASVLKPGAILSDVGSVKQGIVEECLPLIPDGVHFVPAHPLAGTEFSGPDAGLPRLFADRWCILTPPEGVDQTAIKTASKFWEGMGSKVEVMSPARHDTALAITSHLPHLAAFSIFHTALAQEEADHSPVIQFSAGAFKDFTRIASSNPVMWRDIFLMNREPVLKALRNFIADMEACARAIEAGDGDTLENLFSVSRSTRRKVIEKEHISQQPKKPKGELKDTLFRPYSQGD
ncbi:MAG: prephenate dehydrogenase/arogenate dehydrogenase family protein [Nitratireductor sp.]|nr:prephenate dehydrogenase/arogenate dehydrogenase family protein [Nitratireductor sp.]